MNLMIPAEYRGQFTIYQVDMNETNFPTGSYFLTKHKIPQLLYKVRLHAWNLIKTLYRNQMANQKSNYELQLVMKMIDMNLSHMQKPMIASLGVFSKWESNLFSWFEDHIDGCNLYVDMFYILVYEKEIQKDIQKFTV